MKSAFREIEELTALPAFELAESKDKTKNDLTPHELLEDFPGSPKLDRLRWKVLCEQLSDGNYSAFERLYYDTDVIDIYELLSVRTAIYAARDD